MSLAEDPMDVTPSLYDELKKRARGVLRKERCTDHETLSLVNEACVNLLGGNPPEFEDRAAFLAYTASVLRNTLVNLAKHRRAEKRGGGVAPVPIDDEKVAGDSKERLDIRVLDVNASLERLAVLDPSLAELVEMRYFGGYSCREIAEARRVETQSIEDRWRFAKRWLRKDLGDDPKS